MNTYYIKRKNLSNRNKKNLKSSCFWWDLNVDSFIVIFDYNTFFLGQFLNLKTDLELFVCFRFDNGEENPPTQFEWEDKIIDLGAY